MLSASETLDTISDVHKTSYVALNELTRSMLPSRMQCKRIRGCSANCRFDVRDLSKCLNFVQGFDSK